MAKQETSDHAKQRIELAAKVWPAVREIAPELYQHVHGVNIAYDPAEGKNYIKVSTLPRSVDTCQKMLPVATLLGLPVRFIGFDYGAR